MTNEEIEQIYAKAALAFMQLFQEYFDKKQSAMHTLTRHTLARRVIQSMPILQKLQFKPQFILDNVELHRMVETHKAPDTERIYWFPKGTTEERMVMLMLQAPHEINRGGRIGRHPDQPRRLRKLLQEQDKKQYRKLYYRDKRRKQKLGDAPND